MNLSKSSIALFIAAAAFSLRAQQPPEKQFRLLSVTSGPFTPAPAPTGAEILVYNGLRLPPPWPPPDAFKPGEPMPLPYLDKTSTNRQPVAPIDTGRHLFVDDYLIESTTLQRVFHQAEYHTNSPVLKPDQPWEMAGNSPAVLIPGSVWFDPMDSLFKMWYLAGGNRVTCFAKSTNGLNWDKPALDVQPGSNVVLPETSDAVTIWQDQEDPDQKRRFKMFRSHPLNGQPGMSVHVSADGIHWGAALRFGPAGQHSTAFRNPFRTAWVFSLAATAQDKRVRRYWETKVKDFSAAPPWANANEPVLWVGADKLDPARPGQSGPPQLECLNAVAYENLFLGLFTFGSGGKNLTAGSPPATEICVGFSRDGFHWDRPDRRPFIAASARAEDWNGGSVQSAGGCCLVVGRRLWFYVGGRAGGGIGLATLRRDGFASMEGTGTLTTRPVRFAYGKTLVVNTDVSVTGAELRVELLDTNNQVIQMPVPMTTGNTTNMVPAAMSKEEFNPVANTDTTFNTANWKLGSNLSPLQNTPVKLRFHLTNAKLYSFWISPVYGLKNAGASAGFVAAGGPHFVSPIDSVGNTAYRPFAVPPSTNTPPAKSAAPTAPAPAPPSPAPAPKQGK